MVSVDGNEVSKAKVSWRASRCEARREEGGDGGRHGDSGSRGVDWQK